MRSATNASHAPGATAAASRRDFSGLSPALVSRLAKLDLRRDQDLVLHLPLRYEDETRLTPIAAVTEGEALQIEGEVSSCEVVNKPRRQLLARIRDESGDLSARWLSFYPALQKQLQPGARVRLFGEVRCGFFGDEMVHPRVRVVADDAPLPDCLTPVYPTTAGLAQAALRRLIARTLARVSERELLPDDVRARLALPGFAEAVRTLHRPPPDVDADALAERSHPAWRRVKFEELLVQQISLRRAYVARRLKTAPEIAARARLTVALLQALPFELTGAQRRVVAEIAADLAAAHPMQRLLQGDVGSGKTIVAALAMLQAVENGFQAALMAPTEILAEQHYLKLKAWLEPLGIDVAWLSGSRNKRARAAELARLACGECLLAVGTHALIEDPVALPRLGLVIVDEQHRFGVRQRLALREKAHAGASPHLLMMSATPIPRTLAMTHYADLDVSVL
nr:DEAD/DEAH box helicase [Zoogloeaceae bacterium]